MFLKACCVGSCHSINFSANVIVCVNDVVGCLNTFKKIIYYIGANSAACYVFTYFEGYFIRFFLKQLHLMQELS